jgi:hypothetical protein
MIIKQIIYILTYVPIYEFKMFLELVEIIILFLTIIFVKQPLI